MAINPKITLLDLYSDPNSFQFQSKNLKYDKDIRGGGYSGQPFIKRVAPKNNDNLDTLTTEALSLDYPIRGGSYEELAAREDFARIDRFLLSYPRGKAFLDKQRGLMLSNPKIPMAKSGGLFANRAYSDGRNLMTQIADAGTGIRNPNAGEDVFVLERFENKYEYITATTPVKENRLVLLKDFKLSQPPQTTASSINQLGTIFQSLGDTVSNLVNQSPSVSPNVDAQQERAAFNYGINTVTTGELFNYTGGPGSLYGIVNNTLILRGTNSRNAFIDTSNAQKWIGSFSDEDNRTAITKNVYGENVQGRPIVDLQLTNHLGVSKKYNLNATLIGINANNESETISRQSGDGFIRAEKSSNQPANETTFKYTMGYDSLIASGSTSRNGFNLYPDFRVSVMGKDSVQSRDYTDGDINKITRVGIGDPGSRPEAARINTNTVYEVGQDRVNMSDVVLDTDKARFGDDKRDLVKFAFEIIDNDDVSLVNAIHFRAFLTGYTDTHNAEWSAKRYSGRGENFYTYQGFERDVNFNFKVAAQSKQEMRFIYKKLNLLLSTLYPDYSSAGFMRGNITKLTIGDLFVRTPGILTGLNLTVDDNYPWEIAFDEPEGGDDEDMLETPQIIDVATSFKPILNVLPQTGFTKWNPVNTPILLTGGANASTNAYEFLNSR